MFGLCRVGFRLGVFDSPCGFGYRGFRVCIGVAAATASLVGGDASFKGWIVLVTARLGGGAKPLCTSVDKDNERNLRDNQKSEYQGGYADADKGAGRVEGCLLLSCGFG